MTTWTVEEVESTATHDLRRRVLRQGTPSSAVEFAQDAQPDTFHLAVRDAGAIVGVSTWACAPWRGAPGEPALRLRGMAVDPVLQGCGVGAALVRAGLERAWAGGAHVVWAAARDTALPFYRRLGFAVDGDGYVDDTTALPHHDIWIRRVS